MHTQSDESARALFTVLETGNASLAREVVAPDFTNRESAVAPSACSLSGPAGVLASSAWMRSAFDDLHFHILETACNATQVWVRLRMQGLHTGPFVRYRDGALDQAIPPTGKRIDFEQIHVLTLAGNKVTGHEAGRDDVTMLGQLGAFPPRPAVVLRMLVWNVTGRSRRAARGVSDGAARASTAHPDGG